MTNLFDGQITDLLLNDFSRDSDVQALSYAILQEKRRLLRLADRTRTAAMIDALPEKILDELAIELRAPYYSEDMTLDQKTAIIKGTLLWFSRAGTPAAVQELVTAVFGSGEVVEWFNFSEAPYTPGTFEIVTSTRLTPDIVEQFVRMISQVKNTRSHLRRVSVERTEDMTEYVGAAMASSPFRRVINSIAAETEAHSLEAVSCGAISASRKIVMNSTPARQTSADGAVKVAAAMVISDAHMYVVNDAPPRAGTIGQSQSVAVAAAANSNKSIVGG